MDMSAAREAFVQEARELLDAQENALLETESCGVSEERVNAIFRAAHTIKGSAGLFALDLIVSFTHVMEGVLEHVRNHPQTLDGELISVLLSCGDYLRRLIDGVDAGRDAHEPDAATRSALIAALDARIATAQPVAADAFVAAEALVIDEREGLVVDNACWHLSLRFGIDTFRQGMDPMSFIHYLERLGTLKHVHTLDSGLPASAGMDPESCYLGFEIDLLADVDKAALEQVFEFVREGSRIRVLPPRARIEDYIALIEDHGDARAPLGEILVGCGALTRTELDEMLRLQSSANEAPVLGQLLIDEAVVHAPVVAAALAQQKSAEMRATQEHRVIKVEAAKLDQLINLVGELVIAGAGARLVAEGARQAALSESLGEVCQLVEQVRDQALNLRMIPIGDVFQRFPRVVRDVSQELGKRVSLEITGADAELDKSMVEKLADPLTHIVRNALDHGIESVDERIRAGKPEVGVLRLHAYHESGCIVIEVSDDGRGLDTARIRQKAIERGMLSPDATPTPDELHALIFAPGFSTARSVTQLSGRGVGMDVVKRNIEQLRGEIDIDSRAGLGTTMRIRLPLTLAIIDGFQVAVGEAVFVIPLEMVVECSQMSLAHGAQHIANLRGEVLPYVRLRELFDLPAADGVRESLVVVEYGRQRAGLVVDRLLGELQAVIKPLGQVFRGLRGLSGSTILGDGSVALILDVPSLIAASAARNKSGAAYAPHVIPI
ncbi:MAG: chemotaxis protein CheA [Rhodocyclaceae bacterium]